VKTWGFWFGSSDLILQKSGDSSSDSMILDEFGI
jgi:hypothetical protein